MFSVNWIECKEACSNCPLLTDDTSKEVCEHPWRHEVSEHLELSGDGTLPFDMPEVCAGLGATVSRGLIEGKRPSVQVFEEEPPQRAGYQRGKIE